jgi:hypothetical protein
VKYREKSVKGDRRGNYKRMVEERIELIQRGIFRDR